jgi:hypothetical protein
MRRSAITLATLLMAAAAQGQSGNVPAAPDESAQNRILAAMHHYAAEYVANLPNFICDQITHQFEAGRKPKHWHKGDILTSKLVFNQGREERTLELVNNKPVEHAFRYWRAPLTSEGEFGMLIETVFGPSSQAEFQWDRWDEFDGSTVAVFDYSIERAHSTLSLSLSDLAKAVVAYHGSVYADPQTGVIRRISSAAEDIPPEVHTRSIGTVIEYGNVDIAGQKYFLPLSAIVSLATESGNVRNEIEFRNYRKFEADSHITYADAPGDSKRSPQN